MRRLKYFLDKGTLEKIYFAYVRPIMEYSSAVWDNCTIAQSTKLEQLQLDAARITTGAVKGTKHMLLYNETGWQTLSERRENSQLSIMYKMLNNLVPNYLSLLVSRPRQNHYVLRDNKRIPTINAKTNIYMNSFLPKTVSNWNALPHHTKLATSPESFKNKINKRTKPPTYYNIGVRRGQIIHAKLRMQCSDLNHYLVERHILENRRCPQCGSLSETPEHYLLQCPKYAVQKNEMKNKLDSLSLNIVIDSDLLLFGSKEIDNIKNKQIMETVIKFILASKRF